MDELSGATPEFPLLGFSPVAAICMLNEDKDKDEDASWWVQIGLPSKIPKFFSNPKTSQETFQFQTLNPKSQQTKNLDRKLFDKTKIGSYTIQSERN